MFSHERTDLRMMYISVCKKLNNRELLTPLEQQIASVITQHPEYHALLNDPHCLDRDFAAEQQDNPFMHMGLHLALQEQLQTKRPATIDSIYQQLVALYADAHLAQHAMMQCLADLLWEAQQHKRMPDEQAYVARLMKLL